MRAALIILLPLGGWDGEWWLDHRRQNVRDIMEARLDLAAQKGCDGVEPDNVDGYQNSNGLGLTRADQIDYLEFLSREAHERGLSIGLKNAVGLVDEFDFAVNEECDYYNECESITPFIDAGKAVFHVEYNVEPDAFCSRVSELGFSSLHKNLNLGSYMTPCWE